MRIVYGGQKKKHKQKKSEFFRHLFIIHSQKCENIALSHISILKKTFSGLKNGPKTVFIFNFLIIKQKKKFLYILISYEQYILFPILMHDSSTIS